MSQLQVTGEAKIRDIQGPVVANSGVVTALDGAASQYVRGDGTLADFPTSSGGGSSVSYYLNSSVSQGTIGGVAYRELSKDPIIGTGTDIAISSNGYVANYITDVNDPDVTIVAGGNFNCEFYFSVNNNTGNPTTYAELYKYDGTTFTLLGTSAGVPESINQGTTIAPYYFAIPVATASLALTDRLAIRIYVNVDGRTVTLHTENGHLCQVVTTLSKGMVSLNNLTDQSQFLTTGTAGTNFAIASSGDTHTFNLPVASATNTGKLSSTDWSTFNNKQNTITDPITGTGVSTGVAYFNSGTSITSEAAFNYDASTNRLGVNTSVPNATIGANAALDSGYSLLLKNDNANYNSIGFATDSTYGNMITADRVGAAPSRNLTLYNYAGFVSITEAGNLGVGILTPNTGIDIYNGTTSSLWLHTANSGVTGTDGVRLALFSNNGAVLRNNEGTLSMSSEGDFSIITIGAENFRVNSADGSIYQSKVANAMLKSVSGVITAAVANTDYQAPITLTTTGSSGPATLSGSTLNIPDYSTNTTNFVTISGTQTITGTKTFNEAIRNESGLLLKNGVISGLAGYTSLGGSVSNGLVVQLSGSANQQTLSFQTGGAYSYTFPASTGTLALTSDLSSYVPTSRTLTINGETYDLSANRTWTISGITGSGAVGRVAYWNGTSSVTSEAAFNYDDNLNRLGVNTNSPNATIGSNANTDSGFSLLLKNSDTNYSGIGFATDSTYGNMIETVRIGTAPSRNLTLYNYAGFISLTEAGNLGVGILTPNTGIDIYHSTISSLWLHTASSGTSGTDGVRLFLSSNSNAVLRNNEGSLSMSSESDFYVITLGAENIRVNSANGYVGIGNPATLPSMLTVNGGATITALTTGQIVFPTSGGTLSGSNNLFWDNATDSLRIGTNTNGNRRLTIYSSSDAQHLSLIANVPAITFGSDFSYSYYAGIGMATANNNFVTGTVLGDLTIGAYNTNNIYFYNANTNSIRMLLGGSGDAIFSGSVTARGPKSQIIVDGNSVGCGISLTNTIVGSDRRNWGIFTEQNVNGDFVINRSNSAGGSASSGTTILSILNTGAATFSGSVGVGGSPSGTYGTLSVFGGISTKNDNNGKLEIGRYSSGAPNSYIKLGTSSDSLRITNNNDTADIFTITNSGNVGIGTSSPNNALLDVSAGGYTSAQTVAINIGANIGQAPTRSANSRKIGNITGQHYNNTDRISLIRIDSDSTYTELLIGGTNELKGANVIDFYTASTTTSTPTSKMKIFSGGQVAINRNDAGGGAFCAKGFSSSSSANALYIENSSSTELFSVRNDGVIRTGTAAGSPYNNTSANIPNLYVSSGGTLERGTASSQRFKENILEWDGNGLNTILALKPTTFTYKESYYKHPERVMLGLIAEEVAEVCPYLADYENEDGSGQVENVRYANIVVPLIKAIQELEARIKQLENK